MINGSSYSLEALSEAVNYHRFVYDLMRPYLGHRVLEFGAGIGNQTPLFLENEREVLSIDIDDRLLSELRSRVPENPMHAVRRVRIQDLAQEPQQRGSYDAVVSSNVLEHLSDQEEREAVEAMSTLLKHGGFAVHWVPAFPGLFGSLDRVFAHHRRYTRGRAERLFRECGFDIVRSEYWNMIGFFGWWFYGKILRVKAIPRSSALRFDRYGIPLIRHIEPKIWRPFGQSLLVIAQKPREQTA